MKAVDTKTPTKLNLEAIPSDLACPVLSLSRTKQLPLLFASFVGSLGFVAGIGACLASILITIQLIQPKTEPPSLMVITNSETEDQAEPEQDHPTSLPSRLATSPIPPASKSVFSITPRNDSPTAVEIPETEVKPVPFMEMEELALDNPFASDPPKPEPKKEIQKKSPSPEEIQRIQQERLQKIAALKKREAALKAARAKRMAKSASLVSRASPVYPRTAQRKNIQGRVIVKVTIGTSGQVVTSSVSESSGDSSLDKAAIAAAKQFRFRPAINGLGQAMPSAKRIPFDFRLR